MGRFRTDHFPHPVRGVLVTRRVRFADLANEIGYSTDHVEKVVNRRFPAFPEFRRRVSEALNMPESLLFDAESSA